MKNDEFSQYHTVVICTGTGTALLVVTSLTILFTGVCNIHDMKRPWCDIDIFLIFVTKIDVFDCTVCTRVLVVYFCARSMDGMYRYLGTSVIFPVGGQYKTGKVHWRNKILTNSQSFSICSALLQDNPIMGNTLTIGDVACIAAATLTAVQVMTPANPIGSSVRLMQHLRKQVRTPSEQYPRITHTRTYPWFTQPLHLNRNPS